MQEEFTLNDIEKIVEGQIGKHIGIQTIRNYIREENFYNKGLACKKPNGFEIDDKTGKIWLITRKGVENIIDHFKNKQNVSSGRLRPVHLEHGDYYTVLIPVELVEKNEITSKDKLVSTVINCLEDRYDKTIRIEKEKEKLLKAIDELQARYNELESIG